MMRPLILPVVLALVAGCTCGDRDDASDPGVDEAPLTTTAAVRAASDVVHDTLEDVRIRDVDDARRHLDEALASGDAASIRRAMETMPSGPRADEDHERHTRALEALGRTADVRAAAITRALRHPDDLEARRAASASWIGAEELAFGVTAWAPDEERFLEHFDGQPNIAFRWRNELRVFASFTPRQSARDRYFRSEVAAFRLATILGLDIDVPRSTEVQLSWDDFHQLARLEPGDESFHETDARIEWTGEGDERFVRGVAKSWIRGLVPFPIEYDEVWRPWLDGTADLAWMRQTQAPEALDALRDRAGEHAENVAVETAPMKVFRLAHQLSDLHVFDVLINNGDRYQSGSRRGANCHIHGGSIISVNNSGGFPTADGHDATQVQRRIAEITRFSRGTWMMLNALDPQALRPVIFDETDIADAEDERFAYFVERWNWMRDHIQALIDEHGEAEVIAFP